MSAPVARPRAARLAVDGVGVVVPAAVVGLLALVAAALVSGVASRPRSWEPLPVLAAAAVGVLAWPAARAATRRVAARVARRDRPTPDEVVAALGQRTTGDLTELELFDELADALVRHFSAAAAEVWRADAAGHLGLALAVPARRPGAGTPTHVRLDPATARVLRASRAVGRAWLEMWLPEVLAGRSEPEVRGVPVVHAGTVLGLVVLVRRDGVERFAPQEDAALAELGTRLGVVLHNRELGAALQSTLGDLRRTNDELRASRVRLVATADAERRRIERDLHDGAQQHLVALAVNLRLAEDAIGDDPAVAPEVLGPLRDDLREAIAELRTLAHGIYPPLLMDSGLVEALRVAADRCPSPVAYDAGPVGRHAPEVEAAAYFCCVEALQNAAKHAPGAPVRLTVAERLDEGSVEGRGELRVVVEDDGPGIDADLVRPGHGLGNMADRIGAVGGTLEVGRGSSGGTRVEAVVPLGAPAG